LERKPVDDVDVPRRTILVKRGDAGLPERSVRAAASVETHEGTEWVSTPRYGGPQQAGDNDPTIRLECERTALEAGKCREATVAEAGVE
jgi:hypothetical protein